MLMWWWCPLFAFLKEKKKISLLDFFCSCLGVCFPTHVLFCYSSDKKISSSVRTKLDSCLRVEKKFEPPFLSLLGKFLLSLLSFSK